MSIYLDYFDDYVAKGLNPIAIFPRTKFPTEFKWNQNWAARRWRKYFLQDEEYEIGLLWNQGFVDVETDDHKSNDFLNRLIGDVPRPIFKSKRSYHNIFLTPNPKLTKVNLYGKKGEKIEIFGRKTFTLAPPSKHIEGATYSFINDVWPPPQFPNGLKAFYFQQKKIVLKNKSKTLSICSDCKKEQCIHKKRLALEVKSFSKLLMGWKCHKCRKKYKVNIKEECRPINRSSKLRMD
jgi:hypothetical protein